MKQVIDSAVGTERPNPSGQDEKSDDQQYSEKSGAYQANNSKDLIQGKFNPDADPHTHYEFGGPWGSLGLMILFPCLMYYFFICLWCYDGQLSRPDSLHPTEIIRWSSEFWKLIKLHTRPTWSATYLYMGLLAHQVALAWYMPGVSQEGLPIPSLNGGKLTYYCNALCSWYATLATVFVLHSVLGVVRLGDVFDQLGHLMTIATVFGFAISLFYYVLPILQGQAVRMSGNHIYDFFMGAALSPRIGHIDVKLFAEVRIPWVLLFIIAVAGSVKQYETIGYVTPNSLFMVYGTGLYINACAKGEECIPLTWDMAYEKWGWLLSFWNFAGVAFTYCHSVIYITNQPPSKYNFSTWSYVALYLTYTLAYYVFDTSNSQKARFKMENDSKSQITSRIYGFPQFSYGTLKNPKVLVVGNSDRKLLIDGWWAVCRHPNYTADFIQALCWAACSGTGSLIPYFYPAFFLVMILHRCTRNFERCSRKYGKSWEEYCRLVPYSFIPGVI
ncbi:C-24(28) sterol reductase [Puccinia graminis f. sp. tritici]|uniref:Delta(24(24(1)))-sterol reductase n=1 Tax=Puccinia graminis f. sp. tritici TaxID=56615 RepID=A0A5B0MJP3_PUCGR|nr:C-24(28) sterol reductase [Puccinia graminis f. sp. tritici]KAA1091386.1 C-24(28) sterol reductase [Puccinia graminis f. sp. tritici]